MTDTTFDPRRPQRLVILQHAGLLTPKHGKTGISLLRYRGDEVVAVIDREAAGRSLREITRLPLKRDVPIVASVLVGLVVAAVQGLITNCNTAALSPLAHVAGTAAAIVSTVSTAGGSLLASLANGSFNGSTMPFTVIVAAYVGLAALFGAPEAYILNRMKSPWRGLFLLVILGPLLISVVARTLGWALLFGGSSGVANKALMSLGVIAAPLPFIRLPMCRSNTR